ncbi:O-antigen ligase like membrane protein [Longilinea arvoryzae]|uniref:O-antigen ligase like membrane protein n=1 Tax=Longilinea arvoryzae TaxID=360412 RepID=A0A0S7B9B0_9CHLR|nr:O-antigen ligase family protein [Longilinea arvoryzae]GAP13943.1 O-antigen ligase like membrane protein [Longilinea arvoryzae]
MNPAQTEPPAVIRSSKLDRIIEILWAGALILLPVTSAPYIIKFTGTLVAPPSAILIGILLIIALLPRILRRGTIPIEAAPLFFFVLLAIVSTGLSFFIDLPTFKNANPWKEALEAFITIGIGISFFLVCATLPKGEDGFRKALRWITIGGIVMVVFSLVEAYFIFVRNTQFAPWYIWLEETLVTPRPFSRGLQRLYGMTFEPSWFTHQLVMLYIPIWLGASFLRISVFKFRFLHLSVENILLAVSLFLFLLAKPRVSLLAALLIFAFIFFRLNSAIFKRLQKRLRRRYPGQTDRAKQWSNLGIVAGMIFIYLLLAAILIVILLQDPRMTLLFTYPPTLSEIGRALLLDENTLLELSKRFRFMERVIYWVSGWRVFGDYPIFGVGPGNSGFFFLDKVPFLGWTSIEVRDLLTNATFLPNIKSLWVRLLAETGLVGFSIFVSWIITLWRSTRSTLQSTLPYHKLIAFVCQLMLIALIAEGFSIDSFALPYLWVAAGLAAAAGASHRENISRSRAPEAQV